MALLAGCAGLQADIRPNSADELSLSAPLEVAWTYNARAGFGPDAPESFRDLIMVSTRQGEVHLIETDTGRRIGSKRFGDAINGAPVLVNGTLVVPLAAGRSTLVGYDLDDARVLWRWRGAPIHTGLAEVDNHVILVDIEGTVQSVRATDGNIVWTFELPQAARVHARPVVQADRVFIIDDQGHVFALDASTGALIWEARISGHVYNAPTVREKHLVVPTTRGRLSVLDAHTGAMLWTTALPDTTVRFSTPDLNETTVVAGASDGYLRMWEVETGELRWAFDGGEALVAAPVLTDDHVYAASMGQTLYVVRTEDGSQMQEIELRGRVKSSMARQSGGLVVLTEPRYVMRLVEANGEN